MEPRLRLSCKPCSLDPSRGQCANIREQQQRVLPESMFVIGHVCGVFMCLTDGDRLSLDFVVRTCQRGKTNDIARCDPNHHNSQSRLTA